MVQLFVNPADVGHGGIARRRTYIFYYNWMRTDYCFVFDIYQKISREILKLGTTQPRGQPVDYLLTDRELFLVYQLDLVFAQKFKELPMNNDNIFYFLGDRFEHSLTWSAYGRIPCYRE